MLIDTKNTLKTILKFSIKIANDLEKLQEIEKKKINKKLHENCKNFQNIPKMLRHTKNMLKTA